MSYRLFSTNTVRPKGRRAACRRVQGWGLSITKKFAELLGGTGAWNGSARVHGPGRCRVGVESEVGKGSTFTVRVPVDYGELSS